MPLAPEVAALRRERKARRLTQAKLAELSGIHATHISRIERGKSLASLGKLVDLALALDLEPDYLVKLRLPGGLKLEISPQPVVREPRQRLEPSTEDQFVAVIRRTPDGYSASIPDLPGCTVSASTKRAAETSIREAAYNHLQALRKARRSIPAAEAYAIAVALRS